MDKNPPASFNPYRNVPVDIRGEAFARFINGEVDFIVPEKYYNNAASKFRRRYAVGYIETLHSRSGGQKFDALIPYTAMTYFDRFCSVDDVLPELVYTQLDLLLTCCLTIAWKLRTKTFNLPQFLDDNELPFTGENLLRMELQICKRLKWRIRALTPFSFVEYFLQMLDINVLLLSFQSPLHSIRQLILTSQYDIAFTKYRPSVVAASAILLVAKMMLPAHHRSLERRIRTSEILNPHVDMLRECEEKLESLYYNPPTRAAGEGPSSSSAEEQPPPGEIRSTLAEFKSDPLNPDELMNFELGWVEALRKLDPDTAPIVGADGTSSLAQRLVDCCNGFRQGCHIL